MKSVRMNVFETNSSSSHAFHVEAAGASLLNTFSKKVCRKGVFEVTASEYGWEYFRYYTLENKLKYIFTAINLMVGLDGSLWQDVKEMVKAQTGVSIEEDTSFNGYIESDNLPKLLSCLSPSQSMFDLLFSPKSYIETGNDNSRPPEFIGTDMGREFYYDDLVFQGELPEYSCFIFVEYAGFNEAENPGKHSILIKDAQGQTVLSVERKNSSRQGRSDFYFETDPLDMLWEAGSCVVKGGSATSRYKDEIGKGIYAYLSGCDTGTQALKIVPPEKVVWKMTNQTKRRICTLDVAIDKVLVDHIVRQIKDNPQG